MYLQKAHAKLLAYAAPVLLALSGNVAYASPAAHGEHHSFDLVTFLFHWPSEADPRIGLVYTVANFIVLLMLINRLVYRKLVRENAERHEQIKKELADAKQAKITAEGLVSEFTGKIASLEEETRKILDTARTQAERDRQRVVAEAEDEAAKILQAARDSARREAESRQAAIEREIVSQAITKAEAILKTQFSDNDHHRFVDKFVNDAADVSFTGGQA